MTNQLDRVFYDSSQILYGSGRIGYRWAPKTLEIAAKNLVMSYTDVLSLQEVLDFFHFSKEYERGETIFSHAKNVMSQVLPVTLVDFDLAFEKHKRCPGAHPRALLHAAVMENNNLKMICTTFATGYEKIPDVTRVNLMEKVSN